MTPVTILAPTHRLAEGYAYAKRMMRGTFKTATSANSLRGRPANIEIIVVDIPFRWPEYPEITRLLDQRFTNVRHDTF